MKLLVSAIVLSLVVVVTRSHICLLNPQQRSPLTGVNTVGSNDCYLVAGPCGGQKSRPGARTVVTVGNALPVIFQKNLDHHNDTNPGYFAISIGQSQDSMKEVARLNDTSDGSGHIYVTDVALPKQIVQGDGYALQVSYVSNTVPVTFYQCADIVVL